jgi:hypothetical protein
MKKVIVISSLLSCFLLIIYFLFSDHRPSGLAYRTELILDQVRNTGPLELEEEAIQPAQDSISTILDPLSKNEVVEKIAKENSPPQFLVGPSLKTPLVPATNSPSVLYILKKDSAQFINQVVQAATPTGVGATSFEMYKSSVKPSVIKISKTLTDLGVKKAPAAKLSKNLARFLGKQAFKRATIFFTASSAVIAVQSLLFSGLSTLTRIIIAIIFGVIIVVAYVIAHKKGLME